LRGVWRSPIEDLNTKPNECYYDIPLNKCICCGTCCIKFQPRLELEEAKRISNELGLTLQEFLTRFTDPRWPGTQSYLVRHVNSSCIFLKPSEDNKQHLCSIHNIKPSCCIEWKAGMADHQECRQGLKRIWNLDLDADGKIKGSQDDISKLQFYLNSIKD